MSDVTQTRSVFRGLAPLVAIVFVGFTAVAAPLPALSLFVHGRLGYGVVVVGWSVGLQSIATVLTRHWAGTQCDIRGPRWAVLAGLPVAASSGLLYLASAALPVGDATRLALLLAGRVVLGLGESLFITGTMAWGIARLGPARTGTVMAWQGIAFYAALGVGAPIGLGLQQAVGFEGVALLTLALPLLASLVALALPGVPGTDTGRVPFHRVLGLIWQPGLVLMLATIPYAAMASFIALDFASRGWAGAGWALFGFAAGYIAVRLVAAHWPDKHGAVRVATASLAIEAVGQAVLWLAPNPSVAAVGAVLTGVGFSLIFPAMGVEATRRVPPAQRGRAVGNFIAFFDGSLALTGPLVGALIGLFGPSASFAAGAAACGLALLTLASVRPS